jgi:hypothetical protein
MAAEWNSIKITCLIEFFRNRPFLYNVHLPAYRNKQRKHAAIEELSDQLDISVDDINKKWKILRDHFASELKKSRLMKSGMGTDEVYVSKWRYYGIMSSFLTDHVSRRHSGTIANIEELQSLMCNTETVSQPLGALSSLNSASVGWSLDSHGRLTASNSQNASSSVSQNTAGLQTCDDKPQRISTENLLNTSSNSMTTSVSPNRKRRHAATSSSCESLRVIIDYFTSKMKEQNEQSVDSDATRLGNDIAAEYSKLSDPELRHETKKQLNDIMYHAVKEQRKIDEGKKAVNQRKKYYVCDDGELAEASD